MIKQRLFAAKVQTSSQAVCPAGGQLAVLMEDRVEAVIAGIRSMQEYELGLTRSGSAYRCRLLTGP